MRHQYKLKLSGDKKMNFSINKGEFMQAIQEVQRVTYGKVGLTTLQGILIKAEKDSLVLTGGDKNLCVETKVPAEVFEEGSIVVESKLLGDLIKKLPNELIKISTINDIHIKIECDENIVTLVYQEGDNFPVLPSIEEDSRVSLPQEILKNMIKSTIMATDQNSLRPIYSGVLFDFKMDGLNVVALDSSRAAICNYMNENINTVSAVIPARTLGEVGKIIEWEDSEVKITFTANHVLFAIGKTRIISTLLDGDFGKYESFIPKEYTLEIIANKEKLIGHLERASVIGREGNFSAVTFHIQDDNLSITSNSQIGTIRGDLNVISHGMPMVIKFNSKYLIEALNVLEDDEVIIKFTTNQSVFVVTNKNNANLMHIIAPMRM
jgi:DNA polymerase-3 subunit beta